MKKKRNIKQILIGLVSLITFLLLIMIIYGIRYNELLLLDSELLKFYILLAIIGILPILFKLYRFGYIFLVGSVIGFLIDCIISCIERDIPSMKSGFYNFFVIIIGFLLGVTVEVLYHRYVKNYKNVKS
ncbi:MAG: hypothetical protein H0Z24_10120 [Thermosipho sp. (in: Bacteria)]|nr:hypothetical protein [Thermosipho sp. (in: thermotogales)]